MPGSPRRGGSGEQLRDADIIGRFGGEEFVILLPKTPARDAKRSPECQPAIKVAERLRKSVEKQIIITERGDVKITVSLGVAERLESFINVEQIIDNADLALLESKAKGRNQTTIADE